MWKQGVWNGWIRLATLLIAGGTIATSSTCALAQHITIDGTLGPKRTLTGPHYRVPQAAGRTVGQNLFHSFRRFNLHRGETVRFESGDSIRTILARVTGRSPSRIDGLISTTSRRVNLFLLNPHGILFGPHAQLDIGGAGRGSFVATTADTLTWANGDRFSASDPSGAHSLLRIVGDPSGFLATRQSPGPIRSSGSAFQVAEGQSLLLLGGDIELRGGQRRGGLAAPAGSINLAGSAIGTPVGLRSDGVALRLVGADQPSGTVSLRQTRLDTSVGDRGTRGGTIALSGNSLALTNTVVSAAGSAESGTPAGQVILHANNQIALTGSQIFGDTFGAGRAGRVVLHADRSIELHRSRILSSAHGTGRGGDIAIASNGNLTLESSGVLAQTDAKGDAGAVSLRADHTMTIRDYSAIDSSSLGVGSDPLGDAGEITVQAGNLILANGAQLSTVANNGSGGNIRLTIDNLLLLRQQSLISSQAGIDRTGGGGSGGNISIHSSLILAVPTERSYITANAYDGSGGRVDGSTQGIFGIRSFSRDELEAIAGPDLTQFDPSQLPTSSITAISQTNPRLSGQIAINRPEVDPTQGLVTLPTNVVDASRLIVQPCRASETRSNQQGEFVMTGRGGLPPNPAQPQQSESVTTDWATLAPDVNSQSSDRNEAIAIPPSAHPNRPSAASASIVEAQGWVINARGAVTLVANAATSTPHPGAIAPSTCSSF